VGEELMEGLEFEEFFSNYYETYPDKKPNLLLEKLAKMHIKEEKV
jgi:hypothetical protein